MALLYINPMMRLLVVCISGLVFQSVAEQQNKGQPLKDQWPWYNSGDELHAKYQELASSCMAAEFSLTTSSKMNAEGAGQVDLDVIRVRGQGAQPSVRAMFVFGEHARELITGEAALGLVQSLCGNGAHAEQARKVLQNVEFVIVPNANPISRKQVEDGYYCKRTNEDGVDLNRNWSDEHRDLSLPEGDEMFPGPNGFSEPETQILRELVDQETPDIYLSVHSGAYLLGTPWGYQRKKPEDEQAMLEVLKPISDKYCKGTCPYGNLAQLINYENPGCDIDYVYEKTKSPYVFTWEIFVGQVFRGKYEEEARNQRSNDDEDSLAQEKRRTSRHGRSRMNTLSSLETEEEAPEKEQDIHSCMDQFNPHSESEVQDVVTTWSGAFLELCEEVTAAKAPKQTSGVAAESPSKPSSLGFLASDGPY